MKTTNKMMKLLRTGLLCAAIAVTVAACDEPAVDKSRGQLPDAGDLTKTAGVFRSSRSVGDRVPMSLTQGDNTTVDLIYYQLNKPAEAPVTVTARIESSLVDVYNRKHATSFGQFPEGSVQFTDGGRITVDAGERVSKQMKLTFSASGLEPNIYLLPVTIAPEGESAESKSTTLYYGVDIRAIDKIDMPLDENFMTVFYINTDDYQPLLADIFALRKIDVLNNFELVYEHTIGNIVNLKIVQIGYNETTKRAELVLNSNIKYVLEHAKKYIRPLQDKGRKVCLCIQGGGKGLGFCNLNDLQIADFTAQVKDVIELYELDGVNLWDEHAGYGKAGMPEVNTTSYPKLIKALREAMPDKMLTLADKGEPTATFHDTQLTGGIAVGEYLDYAWSGYASEDEDVQLVDPYDMTYTTQSRQPIAGLDPAKYGNINMPWYPANSAPLTELNGIVNVLMWRFDGLKKNNTLVFGDLITRLQNEYEGTLSTTVYWIFGAFSDDGLYFDDEGNVGDEMNYDQIFTLGEIRGYNFYTKDW